MVRIVIPGVVHSQVIATDVLVRTDAAPQVVAAGFANKSIVVPATEQLIGPRLPMM